VRDKIPQIIKAKGLEPVIYTASAQEYATRLRDKLREEVEEFIASDDVTTSLRGVRRRPVADVRGAGVPEALADGLNAAGLARWPARHRQMGRLAWQVAPVIAGSRVSQQDMSMCGGNRTRDDPREGGDRAARCEG
jgi:hypothetical protein